MAVDRRTVLQNAQLYASKGQFDAAIAEWRKLTTDSPADGTIFNSIGDLQLKRHATGEAIAAFLKAAAAFRAEGSVLKAIAAYKKILKVDASRYDVYRHLGDLNAERGLLSSAVQDYMTLGNHFIKEGRNADALDIYRKIIVHDPSNLDAQQRVADLCVQENLQDEAIRIYLQLGREWSATQRYEEARRAYLAVLQLDSSNAEAREIIEMSDKSGPSPTVERPAKVAAASVKSGEGCDLLSEAIRRIDEGQYAGAEAMLTQLLSREPGNPQICQLLARLHLLQGNLQVALGEYRFLAGAALRAQDYTMAESLITEYLKVESNSVPMLELFGELCEEQGDRTAAVQHYGRAVEILLEHPEPGMPTLPAELFEKVQALAPGSPIARKLAPSFESQAEPTAVVEGAEALQSVAKQDTVVETERMALQPAESLSVEIPEVHVEPPLVPQAHVEVAAPAEAAPVEPPKEQIDAEVRYALGMAYKDMGLLEEASEEFALSMKDSGFFVDSCLMIGLCLKEQRHTDQAIHLLERLITDSRCRGGNAQLVRYELGVLYEETGSTQRAAEMFHTIPTFHDVPRRLEQLRRSGIGPNGHSTPAAAPSEPLFRLASQ
ncbi:MAG: hypothetical protein DCC63_15100 [Nitrospira sp.]|mgnify:CR=1 FL=1|nr:MAG: hypothetical protein DCC63_15100 [Nitrospira sp.]